MGIMNGRRIDPNSIPNGVHGSELFRIANPGPGRVAVVECAGKTQPANPNRQYSRAELVDRQNRGAKVTTMPKRYKGGFGGRRSRQSKQIITEQVTDIAKTIFQRQGVDFDRKDANWLVVPTYNLPPRWHRIARSTALMVVLPDEYPALPPVGFYMMADIPISPDGHLFRGVAHAAWGEPINHGWKWYCVYMDNGAWQPAQNWRDGDNLYTYFHLISESLGND